MIHALERAVCVEAIARFLKTIGKSRQVLTARERFDVTKYGGEFTFQQSGIGDSGRLLA